MRDVANHVEVMLGEPHKAVLSMFVPVFIALMIAQINIFVDTVWCSSLGIDAMSAISTVSSIYFIIVGIGNGIGIGVNVAISRRIGAGDFEGASKCASQTIIAMVLISLPIIPILYLTFDTLITGMGAGDVLEECRDYFIPIILLCTFTILNGVLSGTFRGEGAAMTASKINILAAVFNMILDPILIFGLDMGLRGASCATMISAIFAVAISFVIYRNGGTAVKMRPSRLEKSILGDVFYVGFPQTAELFIMGAMNVVLITFVLRCGGTEGLAVYGMPWNLITLFMIPIHSFAAAMVPVCSSAIGQNDARRLRSGYYFTTRAAIIVGIGLALFIMVSAWGLLRIYTYSSGMDVYHDEMVHILRIYALFLPFYGMIYVGSSMLSCLRKSPYALMSSFLRNVLLIYLYALSSTHTMEWIYWSLCIGEIIGGTFMMALAQWQFRMKYRKMTSGAAPA